jgi:N-formylglutamate amidohydrolase
MESAPRQEASEAGFSGETVEPELAPPFEIVAPPALACPLVFSSPHSGSVYPARFLEQARLDSASLRRSEDAYVDTLFACASDLGAPMLRACFPRAYLDVNREPYELDSRMFEEDLPEFVNSRSLRVAAGLGTIPRVVTDAREIYRGKLKLSDALGRIEKLYKPYHAALAGLMEESRRAFGLAILIDCHSMPTIAARDPGASARTEKRRVDFVLGDRFGASCDTGFVDLIERRLRGYGYNVHRNRPYAGGFITEHYGRPRAGWHAMQIEVARGLYMNEATLERNERFELLAQHLKEALAELVQSISRGESGRTQAPPAAAE